MEIVVLIIAIVVGIDALAGRVRAPKLLPPGGRSMISTQNIVIDLSKRL